MTKLEQPIQSENQLQNDKETFDGEQKDDLAILEEDEVHQDNSSVIEDDGVGSNTYLGKFNSVQDLENAYNSLQAEFTRKCQKLKMLEEDIALSKQKVQEDSNAQQAVYEKQDYQEKLNSFLTNYPNAKKYAKEISLEVINNKNLDGRNSGYLENTVKMINLIGILFPVNIFIHRKLIKKILLKNLT